MKIILSEKYKEIESAFEGSAYTPEQEDDFVDWTIKQKKREEKLPFRDNIPSKVKRHGRAAGHRGIKKIL